MKKLLLILILFAVVSSTACSQRSGSTDRQEGTNNGEVSAVSPMPAETAEKERMSLVPYNDGYPEDTVVISVAPTEALYLHGGDGGYIPEDQGKWKDLINKATEHLEPFEYEVMPWIDSLPISISWIRGDIYDAYTLSKDGSMWGYHRFSDDTDYRIPSEDAKKLAEQIKEVYEFLKINPVSPNQVKDLVSAELIVGDQTYPITDNDKLNTLSELLSNASFTPATGCYDRNIVNLRTSAEEKLQIALSADGCGIWQSGRAFLIKDDRRQQLKMIANVKQMHYNMQGGDSYGKDSKYKFTC